MGTGFEHWKTSSSSSRSVALATIISLWSSSKVIGPIKSNTGVSLIELMVITTI